MDVVSFKERRQLTVHIAEQSKGEKVLAKCSRRTRKLEPDYEWGKGDENPTPHKGPDPPPL